MCFCILFAFSYSFALNSKKETDSKQESFTFMSYLGNEFTLTRPDKYVNNEKNIFRHFSRKILGYNEADEGTWYYVHFFTKDIQQISNSLGFTVRNTILKNTYVLFLTIDQVEKIKNISLVKKIDPSEKFTQEGGPIEKTNLFVVTTAPNSELPLNSDLYTIVRKNDEESFIVAVEQNDLSNWRFNRKKKKAVNALVSINCVKKVSTYIHPKVKNNLMTGYTQKNQKISSLETDSNSHLYYFPRYINNKGLNGEGQIITIQDTPIDYYHAMFRDDNVKIVLNEEMPNHRKIIYYGTKKSTNTALESSIEENEHGTHVAGTVAGDSICADDVSGTSLFNGNAPKAKILYAGDLNDVSASDLGKLMNQYGSSISTNSWGVDGYNDYYNYQYGKLAYDNPTKLFLFAAGNEYDQGNFTVCDPGGSKNVLTVGAIGDFLDDTHKYKIESLTGDISIESIALIDADPWIVGTIGTDTKYNAVVIDNTQSSNRKCSLLYGNFVTILYYTSSSQVNWIYDCPTGDTTNGILATNNGNILTLLQQGGKIKITDITKFDSTKPITHADYSSGGPGNKGILKPDIMTPGTHITSAKSRLAVKSNHGCRVENEEADFTYMQGTSMATPNAAGAVALVRQYFEEGKWLGTKYTLDAATMRALMINSCRHPSSKTPDVLFGHGVVDLSTILPFDDTFGVQITNPSKLPSIEEESHLVAVINVTAKNVDLQVTLSYLDPMIDQSSSVPLTHDLDLIVSSPSNKQYKGDHLANGDTQHLSTNEKIIVKTNELEIGQYVIHIYSGEFIDSGLSTSTQKFAVVATGNIVNKTLVFGIPTSSGSGGNNPGSGDSGSGGDNPGSGGDTGSGDSGSGGDNPGSGDSSSGGDNPGSGGDDDNDNVYIPIESCPCSQCNSRDPTKCECDSTHIGPLCQAEITIVNGNSGTFDVLPMEVKRIKFIYEKEIKTIKSKASSNAENATLWFSSECHVTINEYENSGKAGTFLKRAITVDPSILNPCIAIFNNNVDSVTYDIEISDKKSYTSIIIGAVVGVVGAGVIGVASYCLCKKGCCCKNQVQAYNSEDE